MRTTTGKFIAAAILIPICWLPLPAPAAPADSPTTATLATAGAVTSPPTITYRWSDIAGNAYAQSYVDDYGYDDATVTVTYETTGEPTLVGHLSAAGLKPNFAYQIKIVGKPTGLFTAAEGGDDAANERIGYAGRWWEVAPSSGNRTDSYYETYKDDPAYIFEAYLLFDFFLTDRFGAAEVDFALDSSYHVLFWDTQRTQGACDNPLKTSLVSGAAADPAYSQDIATETIGVYPQIERLCDGQTALPVGTYSCRFLLTEESFHTGDGNWAPAMICDDIVFDVGAGLIPPSPAAEPAYTPGSSNTVSWNPTAGASEYLAQCATDAGFTSIHAESGWIAGTSHTFTGLADAAAYHFRVKAGDGAGTESEYSGAVSSIQDATPPASSIDPLPATTATTAFDIPWTAADSGSGVAEVTLHYSRDGGAWTQYDGPFTSSPIDFVAPGDGAYGFYCVARDNAGNQEAAPASADAATTVDTSGGEPAVTGVVLDGADGGSTYPQDLVVDYALAGGATTAATAWYRDGAPEMALYLPQEGDGPAALKNYASTGAVDAVAEGSPAWAADAGHDGNGAFVLDGDDGLDADACQPTGSSYTKTAWVLRSGSGPDGGNAVICGEAESGGHVLWAPDAGGNRLAAGHDGAWSAVEDPDPLPTGVWVFVAVTYDASADLMILYRDGAEADRATVAAGVSDATAHVGSRGPAGGNWVGVIDDARIYGRALSADQIAVLYGAGGRDRVAAAETADHESWQAVVVPFSGLAAGTAVASNILTLDGGDGRTTAGYVDIGNPASEAGHAMAGWGPVEPATHGGGWGGIGGEDPPGRCRTIWSPSEDEPAENWATLELDFGSSPTLAKSLAVRYLDGGSDDSFDILIDDVLFQHIYAPPGTETWRWVRIDVTGHTGVHTLKFQATAPPGTFYDPYGQVGIDRVHVGSRLDPVPRNPSIDKVEATDCGLTRTVDLRYSLDAGSPAARGYRARIACPADRPQLSFDSSDIAVNILPAGLSAGEYELDIRQDPSAGAGDWTVEYLVPGATSGIPGDEDLFSVTLHGDAEGVGRLEVVEFELTSLEGGVSPPAGRGAAEPAVDCSPPAGAMVVNGDAASTGLQTVSLDSDVSDLTAMEMRFSNDGAWSAPENRWRPYDPSAEWTLADGADGQRTVWAEYRDAAEHVLAVQDQIEYDTTGLDPVAGLAAQAGNGSITLSWNYSGDPANEVEIWRAMWYGDATADSSVSAYPEYDDLPADFIPARPADRAAAATAGSGWDLVAVVDPATTTWKDFPNSPLGLRRGIYWYEIFVADGGGGHSGRCEPNVRSHSYLPGDFGLPAAPRGWDGAITLAPDVNTFGLCYGSESGDAAYDPECDIGPTDDYGGMGLPQTDDAIDFADLMILALNFDTTAAKESASGDGAEALLAWSRAASGEWVLTLASPCPDLKGLRLRAEAPPGCGVKVLPGELLERQDSPCFLRNIPGRGLDAGLALLGEGGVTGSGELLRVALSGDFEIGDPVIDARDRANRPLPATVSGEVSTGPPAAGLRLDPNRPNPFNPRTAVVFSLPSAGRARLAIYTIDGRKVRTLLDAELPAGEHRAMWDGRDGDGRMLPSGVYCCLLEAGTTRQARKMTLLK